MIHNRSIFHTLVRPILGIRPMISQMNINSIITMRLRNRFELISSRRPQHILRPFRINNRFTLLYLPGQIPHQMNIRRSHMKQIRRGRHIQIITKKRRLIMTATHSYNHNRRIPIQFQHRRFNIRQLMIPRKSIRLTKKIRTTRTKRYRLISSRRPHYPLPIQWNNRPTNAIRITIHMVHHDLHVPIDKNTFHLPRRIHSLHSLIRRPLIPKLGGPMRISRFDINIIRIQIQLPRHPVRKYNADRQFRRHPLPAESAPNKRITRSSK